jgi:hypothetical protein
MKVRVVMLSGGYRACLLRHRYPAPHWLICHLHGQARDFARVVPGLFTLLLDDMASCGQLLSSITTACRLTLPSPLLFSSLLFSSPLFSSGLSHRSPGLWSRGCGVAKLFLYRESFRAGRPPAWIVSLRDDIVTSLPGPRSVADPHKEEIFLENN